MLHGITPVLFLPETRNSNELKEREKVPIAIIITGGFF